MSTYDHLPTAAAPPSPATRRERCSARSWAWSQSPSGFTALGAYIGRNLSGGAGILFFIGAFACVFGLNIANSRGREQLAIAFLFGLGLLLGLAVAPVIALLRERESGGAVAGRRRDRRVHRRCRRDRLRHPP